MSSPAPAIRLDASAAARLLEGQEGVQTVEIKANQIVVTLPPGVEDYTQLPSVLVQAGYRIKLFREEELNLETAFMTLTKGLGSKT